MMKNRMDGSLKLIASYKRRTTAKVAIELLLRALKAKDEYTFGHSCRVARLAYETALEMNLGERAARFAFVGGLLHDVGKIAVPKKILKKPSGLTDKEYKVVKKHAKIGFNILNRFEVFPREILEIVLLHHEKVNGTGYPLRIEGGQIPILAKIIAVCDAYDAMTSQRNYRTNCVHKEALAEISNSADSHFDSEVARAFMKRFV